MKNKFHPKWLLSRRNSVLSIMLFATIASAVVLFARAANDPIILEAESASIVNSKASVKDDPAASGQQVLHFGAEKPAGTPSGSPTTIVAVSDMQYGPSGTDRTGTAKRTVAMAANASYVIMAGDLAYDGTSNQYAEFDNEYGSILSKIRPSLGNHDNYSGDDASGYNTYFANLMHGTKPNYWYSFDAGSWHIVSLNTGVDTSTASYDDGSTQLQWLDSDLAANSAKPTILYFHAPLYTGANYRDETDLQNSVKPIWKVALKHKVELIINGHDHSYQRYAPMDEAGNAKSDGVREIIAATGCYSQRDVVSSSVPNLEKWSTSTGPDWCGALQLDLFADHYEWKFVNNAGSTLDSGTHIINPR